MEKKYLKWSSIIGVSFALIVFLLALVYLLIPVMISSLTGIDDSCDSSCYEPNTGSGSSQIANSLCELCNTSKSFVAGLIMILILLGGFVVLIPMALTSIDILQSTKLSTPRKLLWAILIWFLFGPFATLAYYLMEKKN